MTEREMARNAARRLAIIRHAQGSTGNRLQDPLRTEARPFPLRLHASIACRGR